MSDQAEIERLERALEGEKAVHVVTDIHGHAHRHGAYMGSTRDVPERIIRNRTEG